MARAFAALVLIVCSTASQAGGLSPSEQRLAAYVDQHVAPSLELLERLVNINSGSMNFDGVRAVGDVLRAELDALGFATRWVPGEAFGRAGHLVAEHKGQGPRILLIGHLDTVFEADSPFQRFERDGKTVARGPGLIDMKGGDVILLLALQALKAEGLLETMNVSVILTGDEEATGKPLAASRAELVQLARASDFAVGFEDGDGDPRTAVVSRRGSSQWELRTGGVRAHSSLIFHEDVGSGAIYEAARILAAFHEIREPHLTFSPGIMLGGSTVEYDAKQRRGTAYGKSNVVPEHVAVVGDLRAFSLEQREEVKRRMQRIAAAHLPRTTATLTFRDSYPPMAPSDANRRLLGLLDRVSHDLGLGEVAAADIGRLGAADVSFAAPHLTAVIDGLGLGGAGGHTVHETADLSTFAVQAKRAAVLLQRLARGAYAAENGPAAAPNSHP